MAMGSSGIPEAPLKAVDEGSRPTRIWNVCNAVRKFGSCRARTRSTLSTVITEFAGCRTRESMWSDIRLGAARVMLRILLHGLEPRRQPEGSSFRTAPRGAGSSRWPQLLSRCCCGRRRHEKISCPRIGGRRQLKTLTLLGLLRLLLPLIALPGAAFACADFSKAPDSRWRVESQDGIASLVTPCGDRFFSIGVNGVDGGSRPRDGVRGYFWGLYEPTLSAWARRARERLLAWGFNTAGGWSLKPQILDMPATIELSLGRRSTSCGAIPLILIFRSGSEVRPRA
jgi:hypothetical protein